MFKPANAVPASAWALTEIIARQPLPAGAFNLVMGSGAEVGERLIQSAAIQALSFTGSVETGRRVAAATAANFVRCQLEMGSKNALVVLDDADLPLAVECAVNGAFFGTGQKCTASSRLIVTEGIHDRYVQALVERIGQLKVGHPLREGVHIGPVIDEASWRGTCVTSSWRGPRARDWPAAASASRMSARVLHASRAVRRHAQ